jgi:hypothetical protein
LLRIVLAALVKGRERFDAPARNERASDKRRASGGSGCGDGKTCGGLGVEHESHRRGGLLLLLVLLRVGAHAGEAGAGAEADGGAARLVAAQVEPRAEQALALGTLARTPPSAAAPQQLVRAARVQNVRARQRLEAVGFAAVRQVARAAHQLQLGVDLRGQPLVVRLLLLVAQVVVDARQTLAHVPHQQLQQNITQIIKRKISVFLLFVRLWSKLSTYFDG